MDVVNQDDCTIVGGHQAAGMTASGQRMRCRIHDAAYKTPLLLLAAQQAAEADRTSFTALSNSNALLEARGLQTTA